MLYEQYTGFRRMFVPKPGTCICWAGEGVSLSGEGVLEVSPTVSFPLPRLLDFFRESVGLSVLRDSRLWNCGISAN